MQWHNYDYLHETLEIDIEMGGQGSAITQISPQERAGLCGRKGTTRRNSALDTLDNQNVAKTPFNFPYLSGFYHPTE
jgi:hypothetical protein